MCAIKRKRVVDIFGDSTWTLDVLCLILFLKPVEPNYYVFEFPYPFSQITIQISITLQ